MPITSIKSGGDITTQGTTLSVEKDATFRANSSDIISVNLRTGEVELWDSKYRSGSTTGKISPTFDNDRTRASAIEEARREIRENKSLAPDIRQKALDNLDKRNFTTYTVGSGKVKSSVIQKYCNNQKCP